MSLTAPGAVLFDLDGTLVDTAGDLVAAVNRLLLRHGQVPQPLRELRPYVSQGGMKLITMAFDIAEDSEQALSLRQEYLQVYRQNLSIHSRLFSGMDALLFRLESRNIPWGVVTNKPEWLTFPLLAELGLDQRASVVVGGDTVDSKPSPAPVLHACNQIDISPQDVVMIGDDKRDIDSGNAAGARTIAAGWGYIQPQDDIAQWLADHCLTSVAELDAWIG